MMVNLFDSRTTRQRFFVAFLVVPAFVVLIGVVVYPFVYNVVISLSNMNLRHIGTGGSSDSTNTSRYSQNHPSLIFMSYFSRPIIWTVVNLVLHVVIGVFLALVLNQKEIRGKAALPRDPHPSLGGPAAHRGPHVARDVQLRVRSDQSDADPVVRPAGSGMAQESDWKRSLPCIITNVWLGFPFMMVIALGALQSIPQELYEAADIDGASWYHKLRNITIPLIRPVMVPAITLGTIWTFNNLNIVWLVSNAGEPSDQTHLLVSFVYKAAFNFYRYGYGAALSMVIFFILLVFSLAFMRKTKVTENVYCLTCRMRSMRRHRSAKTYVRIVASYAVLLVFVAIAVVPDLADVIDLAPPGGPPAFDIA